MAALKQLIDSGAAIGDISAHLGDLAAAARVEQALALGKSAQARLFELAAGGPACRAEDFLAPGGGDLVCEGRNSMPVLSRFQKIFRRGPDGRLYGRNAQTFSALTGPGCFEVQTSPRSKGEMLLNYEVVPSAPIEGWPPVRGNEGGLAALVFGGMHDFVRKAGPGVLIGWAYKHGRDLKTSFILAC